MEKKTNKSNLSGSAGVIAGLILLAVATGFPPDSVEIAGFYLLFISLAILNAVPSVSVTSTLLIVGLLSVGHGVVILVFGSVGPIIALIVMLVGGITIIVTRLYIEDPE
jgi:hypothetical protein